MKSTNRSPWLYAPLRLVREAVRAGGFDIVRRETFDPYPMDADEVMKKILNQVRPLSMATNHRLAAMLDAVRYVNRSGIDGAIVECGVWRGANMMVAALGILAEGNSQRDLFLYDTFEGMSAPTSEDVDYTGASAESMLTATARGTGVWCHATLEDVRQNLSTTRYPSGKTHFIKGKVEVTIPEHVPTDIALLRLDTDWYESTRHELVHLYPRLRPGGVLLIDDYGHWQGARKAVDEYFKELGLIPLLHRIDSTCRSFIKPQ